MNNKLMVLSADLRRISYWFFNNRNELANKFLDRDMKMVSSLKIKAGNRDLSSELKKLKTLEGGHLRAADRALTLSVLLSHHFKGRS